MTATLRELLKDLIVDEKKVYRKDGSWCSTIFTIKCKNIDCDNLVKIEREESNFWKEITPEEILSQLQFITKLVELHSTLCNHEVRHRLEAAIKSLEGYIERTQE